MPTAAAAAAPVAAAKYWDIKYFNASVMYK